MRDALDDPRDDPRTLVQVFLRGGADGLALVPPVADDDYQRLRPRSALAPGQAPALDGFWALHPGLEPLQRWYADGQLAVVPAAGSDDGTRSHFEAQDLLEHGGRDAAGGWLGRWLREMGGVAQAPLAAVAVAPTLPLALQGAPAAVAFTELAELELGDGRAGAAIAALYDDDPLLAKPAADTLRALAQLRRLRDAPPPTAATYGDDRFAAALRLSAALIKGRVGVRAISIDLDGWDSHVLQDQHLAGLVARLGAGLDAFARDLGASLERCTVVVLSEFGRRVRENSALGTDHGRGGAALVLGGGVRGGVHGRWPGLGEDALVGPGDVPVANDFRDVLAPVLRRHAPEVDLGRVFPGHRLRPLEL